MFDTSRFKNEKSLYHFFNIFLPCFWQFSLNSRLQVIFNTEAVIYLHKISRRTEQKVYETSSWVIYSTWLLLSWKAAKFAFYPFSASSGNQLEYLLFWIADNGMSVIKTTNSVQEASIVLKELQTIWFLVQNAIAANKLD